MIVYSVAFIGVGSCPIINVMLYHIFFGGVNLSSHLFSVTPSVDIQRSAFDRSSTLKTAFNSGGLYPIYLDEILPGDSVNMQASLFCRMSTPIVPIMDNLYLETFWFFVPMRLVWDNFKKFMGEQIDPDDSIDFTIPQALTASGSKVEPESLADYFGIPVGSFYGPNKGVNALPARCYYLIYNEFFRDENLQKSVKIYRGNTGVVDATLVQPDGFKLWNETGSVLKRNKRFDYFTSCLPTPQKFMAMSLPLAGSAPVYGNGNAVHWTNGTNLRVSGSDGGSVAQMSFKTPSDGSVVSVGSSVSNSDVGSGALGLATKDQLANAAASGLYADLTDVTAVTVSDLRTAFQIQRLLESQNRSGTRYQEILLGQFHVFSGDARLQRPEYLGGSSCRININPVQQTSATSSQSETPQGNLAAYGVVADKFKGFVKSFTEHGYLIGLVNVRADLNYQQGLNRAWSRKTRFDFYWPTLAHLSEQAVLNKEIYLQGTAADNDVFGYNERWSEYRYKPNHITGKMRSTHPISLDIWHLAQKFDALPVLNSDFIKENPPVSRVVAVPSEPEFILDAYFKAKFVRPMPLYSIPGLIDHF